MFTDIELERTDVTKALSDPTSMLSRHRAEIGLTKDEYVVFNILIDARDEHDLSQLDTAVLGDMLGLPMRALINLTGLGQLTIEAGIRRAKYDKRHR